MSPPRLQLRILTFRPLCELAPDFAHAVPDGVAVLVEVAPVHDIGAWFEWASRAVRVAGRDGADAILVLTPALGREAIGMLRHLLSDGADDVLDATEPAIEDLLGETTRQLCGRAAVCRRLECEGRLLGRSHAMRRVRHAIAGAVGDPDVSVLLLGETGSGKFVAARALHGIDPTRSSSPFHAVDCGAVVATLFGSEIYGHVRGAFTGALEARAGAIATAGRGTLLLDEVGELSPALQASLLTALQERRYRPVGSDHELPLQCRVIAATNRDLPRMVREGLFRPDLYYRLQGVTIAMPPLREHAEDIPDLFREALHGALGEKRRVSVDTEVMDAVTGARFPGNVRELESLARHCARRAGESGRIRLAHLPLEWSRHDDGPSVRDGVLPVREMVASGDSLEAILSRCRRQSVRAAFEMAASRLPGAGKDELVSTAADLLQVSPRTIYGRLREGGLDSPNGKSSR